MCTQPDGVPFSFFVSLLREISQIKPRPLRNIPSHMDTPRKILDRWIAELRRRYSPLPQGITAVIFLLLFPEEDSRRKYDMQETRLAQELTKCFGISMQGRGENLRCWNGETTTGCLGGEVAKVLRSASSHGEDQTGPLSIAEVDALLDELASTSAFSDRSVRQRLSSLPRTKHAILCDLYHSMPALDAAFLTQIILKDTRPILYPLSETHYTAALTKYNTKSMTPLTKEDAMKAWDPSGRMLRTYKVRASLYHTANAYELQSNLLGPPQPQIGTPIEIPKSVKGHGCLEALKHFPHSDKVWAEIKYDGERAQIHVEIREDGSSHIIIFSKSKRDSTLDRYGVHGIIRDALGLSKRASPEGYSLSKVTQNVILDAELVAFSNHLNKIDEFWRIRSLITSTARGARSRMFAPTRLQAESLEAGMSQASLVSDASDSGVRHLALVFFDVLVLDSVTLLSTPYSSRRSILESLVQPNPGYVMLAERTAIHLNGPRGMQGAGQQLRSAWASTLAECEEGLVLKADDSLYNNYRSPWVKLKKDYIPGYGDTIDLVIIAASWDKDRGRELRVAPTAYTTFYVGVLANADVLRNNSTARPHFQCYFTVSYGLTREQLEEANFLIKSSDPLQYNPMRKTPKGLPYTYNMYSGLAAPAVLFQEPLLVELYGAGFTKSPQSMHYELRFPRLTKLYRPSERSWRDGVTAQDLHKIAREAVGRDRTTKDADDWSKDIWGKQASPGVKCEKKRKERELDWVEKLNAMDGVRSSKKMKLADKDSSPACPIEKGNARGQSRPVLGAKPLGPIFNLPLPTPPSSSPSLELSHRVLQNRDVFDSPLRRRAGVYTGSPLRTLTRQAPDTGEGSSHESPLIFDGEIPSTLAPSLQAKLQLLTPPASAGPRSTYSSTPMAKFLDNKYVWFSQPCNATRPTWRPAARDLLAGAVRLNSLESLLVACAWEDQGSLVAKPRPGVIFVDKSSLQGKSWGDHCVKVLQDKHKTPLSTRCPILVFDAKLLAFDALENIHGDPAELAMWRFE